MGSARTLIFKEQISFITVLTFNSSQFSKFKMPRTRDNKPKQGSEDIQTEKENDSPGKYVKVRKPLLQLSKTGGIQKSKKPVSDLTIKANKQVRLALATGEISKDELNRRTDRDLRTLYIRFKSSDTAPKTSQEIFALDKGIRDVRVPRQGKGKEKHNIKYCFVEFNDESTCESTKDKLAANPDFAVDFVGDKSKNRQEKFATGSTNKPSKMPINPCRLHVSGFGQNITKEKLKALFPKSKSATIPKGVDHYGFVEFFQPADAKAAFDAAKKLKLESGEGTQSMTVVFARMQKHGPVPKAEDKSPAKKKRQREQHNEDAKKAKIEEKVAQSAWSAAIKSKTDKTVEDKEDSTDKTDVEQEQVANENVEGDQSESDEDVENDEAEEEDDNEKTVEKGVDKVEEKKVEIEKTEEINEASEEDDDNDDVENDDTDEDEEEGEDKGKNVKSDDKDEENEEDDNEDDVENDDTEEDESEEE